MSYTLTMLGLLSSPCRNSRRRCKFLRLIISSSVIEENESEEEKGRFADTAVVTDSRVASPSASKPYNEKWGKKKAEMPQYLNDDRVWVKSNPRTGLFKPLISIVTSKKYIP